MKTIIKDVLSCKSLRDNVKMAVASLLIAILERLIATLAVWSNVVPAVPVYEGR